MVLLSFMNPFMKKVVFVNIYVRTIFPWLNAAPSLEWSTIDFESAVKT